jgi:hypothetical protein
VASDTVIERLMLAQETRPGASPRPGEPLRAGHRAFPGFNAAIEAGDLAFADHSMNEVVGLALEARYVNHTYTLDSCRVPAAIAGRLDESMRLADEMLALGKAASQAAAPVFHRPSQRLPARGGRRDHRDPGVGRRAVPQHPELPVRAGLVLAESTGSTKR